MLDWQTRKHERRFSVFPFSLVGRSGETVPSSGFSKTSGNKIFLTVKLNAVMHRMFTLMSFWLCFDVGWEMIYYLFWMWTRLSASLQTFLLPYTHTTHTTHTTHCSRNSMHSRLCNGITCHWTHKSTIYLAQDKYTNLHLLWIIYIIVGWILLCLQSGEVVCRVPPLRGTNGASACRWVGK